MTKLSKETTTKLALVQELLKGMYQKSEQKFKQYREEWKHPQDEEDANGTLIGAGFAYGTMKATTHISKFINELVDETLVKEQPKKEKKYMDFKPDKKQGDNGEMEVTVKQDKKGNKEVSIDMSKLTKEQRNEVADALMEAFGNMAADEMEEEDWC